MTHIPKLIGAALRATAAVAASLALIAGSPQGALAHQVVTAGDASSAVIVGVGLGSPETGAQLPGSADRPMLTRLGGTGGTRPATRGGTKAATQAEEHAAAQSAVMGQQTAAAGTAAATADAATADTATAPTAATTTGTVTNAATATDTATNTLED